MDTKDFSGYLQRIYPKVEKIIYSDNSILLSEIKKWIKPEGSILDIGAFTGKFCESLNRLGFKACGIEALEEAVKQAKKRRINPKLASVSEKKAKN